MIRDQALEIFIDNLTEDEANTLSESVKRIAKKYGAHIQELEITTQPHPEAE